MESSPPGAIPAPFYLARRLCISQVSNMRNTGWKHTMLVSVGFFRQCLCRLPCYGNRILWNEWRQVPFPFWTFSSSVSSSPSLAWVIIFILPLSFPKEAMVSTLEVPASLLTVVLWTPTSQVLCLASLNSHYNSHSSLHSYRVSGMVVSNSPAFAFIFFYSHDGWWVKFYYHLHFGVKETGLALSVCVCESFMSESLQPHAL